MSTALETPIEERVYTPASIEEAYRNFPAVGRKIKIKYLSGRTDKAKIFRGVIVQKVKHEDGAHFTVEKIPDEKKKGRYRMSFLFVDLITARVKILGVGG
jgi:uncharacterized protein Veg